MLADVKVTSSSAENCSSFCLNTKTFDSKPFKCLSFDYCPMQESCIFYTSMVTDPSVISQSAPVCEHYSMKPNNRIFEIYFMNVIFYCSNKNYLFYMYLIFESFLLQVATNKRRIRPSWKSHSDSYQNNIIRSKNFKISF
jgi:hypothetical protein